MKYRNDSNVRYIVRDTLGNNNKCVKPGEYVESYVFYDLEGLTLVDPTGLYNPVVANTEFTIDSEAATDHILNPLTKAIIITNISSSVTVRPQLDTAVPLMLNTTKDNPTIVIERPYVYYNKLRITGVGTCTIVEYQEY